MDTAKNKLITCVAMIILSIVIIIIAGNITLPNGCVSNANTTLFKDGFYFDTYISITLYNVSADNEALLDECMDMCGKYEKIFSRTDNSSELYMLNEAFSLNTNADYEISADLYECIDKTLTYSYPFDEHYSVFTGNLCDLWDYEKNLVPQPDAIKEQLDSIYAYKLILDKDNSTISLLNDSANTTNTDVPAIDLGASAKGYIADKLCTYLKEQGITDALIDLGGNIVVIGNKVDNSMFKIGIKKPFSDTDEVSAICKLADTSLVTSGVYQRYFEKDGNIYHHIIDCATGYPTDNDILSVTIISKNALQADCFSTGCLLLGKEDALSFINSAKEVECVIIDTDYNIHLSDGLTYKKDFIVMK